MRTVHATWELDNLGVDAYEIALSPDDTAEMLAEEEKRIAAAGAAYIVLKTPVDCPRLLFGIPTLGYAFVEAVYHVEIKRRDYHMPDVIARFDRGLSVARRTEETELARIDGLIRRGMFVSDRVSIDPAFGVKQGGNRYANWLRTMVLQGGFLYEVLQGERPIGFFVICRKDADTVDPVLMGMYDAERDRGLGTLLHKKTLDTCFTHDCKRLTSTVVSNNSKVFRVYLNAGANVTETLYAYVKHLK